MWRKSVTEICWSRWTAGGRQKAYKKGKTFHTTKCRAYPYEKLKTSKRVIRSRELALFSEEQIASGLWKQEVTNIRRISIRKREEQIYLLGSIGLVKCLDVSVGVKIGYCLERTELCALEVVQMPKIWTPTGKQGEDDRHVPNVVKMIQTSWRKIAWKKLDIIWLT